MKYTIEEIKKLRARISPTPWKFEDSGEDSGNYTGRHYFSVKDKNNCTVCDNKSFYSAGVNIKDQRFIAAAPDIIDQLLKMI